MPELETLENTVQQLLQSGPLQLALLGYLGAVGHCILPDLAL